MTSRNCHGISKSRKFFQSSFYALGFVQDTKFYTNKVVVSDNIACVKFVDDIYVCLNYKNQESEVISTTVVWSVGKL